MRAAKHTISHKLASDRPKGYHSTVQFFCPNRNGGCTDGLGVLYLPRRGVQQGPATESLLDCPARPIPDSLLLRAYVVSKRYLCYTCVRMVFTLINDPHGSDQATDVLIQQWAGLIRRGKITGLAVFALELLKPVGFVASQLLWVADPVWRSLTGHSSRNYALFLEDRRSIERLLATLEDQPLEPPT
jgi:hypothetical protein